MLTLMNWIKTKTIVFKVSGAEYISATNYAAGRKYLEFWLQNHREHPAGRNIHCRRDGKRDAPISKPRWFSSNLKEEHLPRKVYSWKAKIIIKMYIRI